MRQSIRKLVFTLSFLLFPVTIYYFSPIVVLFGLSRGTAAGSLVVFGLLLVGGAVFGRLFCSWVCPAGVIGDLATFVRTPKMNRARLHWIKYLIWVPWIAGLVLLLLRSGGVHAVQVGYATDHGLSVSGFRSLVIYLAVVGVFLILGLIVGKRAGCHTICWMAPFMIIGRFAGRRLGIPGVELRVERDECTACGRCTSACPMSLPVSSMVAAGRMEHPDCSLCGTCADECPRQAIRIGWGARPPAAGGAGRPAGRSSQKQGLSS